MKGNHRDRTPFARALRPLMERLSPRVVASVAFAAFLSVLFLISRPFGVVDSAPLPLDDTWWEPNPIQRVLADEKLRETLKDMVMVAGHATVNPEAVARLASVGRGRTFHDILSDKRAWWLEPYQTERDVHGFLEHVRVGVEEAARNPEALLVFSGGQVYPPNLQSRPQSLPISEAVSYHLAASLLDWFGQANSAKEEGTYPVHERAATEDLSRDSYENLMFSLCRFREITGRYPRRITLISLPSKSFRFTSLHVPAMRFPHSRVTYLSVDDTSVTPIASPDPLASGLFIRRNETLVFNPVTVVRLAPAALPPHELALSCMPFALDPHGCGTAAAMPQDAKHAMRGRVGDEEKFADVPTSVLTDKRRWRDGGKRGGMGAAGCPEMRGLMEACVTVGRGEVFGGTLPWDT